MKYVCKSGRVPEWVEDREKIRIFQPSRGFLKPIPKKESKTKPSKRKKRPLRISTIRERLERWSRTALVITEASKGKKSTISELPLDEDFKTLYDRLVYSIALDGRYLGDGKIKINNMENISEWIK